MRAAEAPLIGVFGQQQPVPTLGEPLSPAPHPASRPADRLGQPLLDDERGRGILVDVPDQIGQPKAGEGSDEFGVVDEHQIVLRAVPLDQGPRRTSGSGPVAPDRPGQVDGAQAGHDRSRAFVPAEGRGIRDLPAVGEQRWDLAMPDTGVLGIVDDRDHEDARHRAHVSFGAGGVLGLAGGFFFGRVAS